MTKYNQPNTAAGVTLVEVVVAVSILAVLLIGVSFGVSQLVTSRAALVDSTVALYLAEEGYEMVRTIRDNDWNDIDALSTGSTYYLDVTPSAISITSTPVVIDGMYTRSFVVENVYRDSDDDIVPVGTAGATVDTNARLVVVTVTGGANSQEFTGLLTNLYTP